MTERDLTSEALYFLGFDGGGTKTECILADSNGRILGHSTAGASNPLRAGYSRACLSLREAADNVLERKKITSHDIRGICAGIGGAARTSVVNELTALLQGIFPRAEIEVTTDIEIAFEAAFDSAPGIVLIAGTGSGALGRDSAGRRERVGGKGPWFSDEGSAFDIGRRAVQAALLADENRGPATALSGRLFQHLQTNDWSGVLDQVSKSPDSVFPTIFPLVAELAESGDAVSMEILSVAATALAALVQSVAENLGWHEGNVSTRGTLAGIPVARVGGMHGRSKFLDDAINVEMTRAVPGWKHVELLMTPAEAAARMAVRRTRNAAPLQ